MNEAEFKFASERIRENVATEKKLIIGLKSGKELIFDRKPGEGGYWVEEGMFAVLERYKDPELLTETFIPVNEIEYISFSKIKPEPIHLYKDTSGNVFIKQPDGKDINLTEGIEQKRKLSELVERFRKTIVKQAEKPERKHKSKEQLDFEETVKIKLYTGEYKSQFIEKKLNKDLLDILVVPENFEIILTLDKELHEYFEKKKIYDYIAETVGWYNALIKQIDYNEKTMSFKITTKIK